MPFESFFENIDGNPRLRDGIRTLKLGSGYGVGDVYDPIGTYASDFRLQIYLKPQSEPAGGAITTCAYFKTENTAALTASQLTTVGVRTTLAYDIFDAYGIQSHLTISGDMGTTDANAHLTAISAKVAFSGTPTVATGWLTAGLFIVEGTGTVTQLCYGVSIVEEAGSTGCQALLHLNTDVGVIPAIKVNATSATGGTVYEATDTHQTFVGSIKINVNGTDRYLHYCDAEAGTS